MFGARARLVKVHGACHLIQITTAGSQIRNSLKYRRLIHPQAFHGYSRTAKPGPPLRKQQISAGQHDKKCHQPIVRNYAWPGLVGRFRAVSYDLPCAPGLKLTLGLRQKKGEEAKLPPLSKLA